MQKIKRQFPDLSDDRMDFVVKTIVDARDAVATVNVVYEGAPWGLACLGFEITRNAFRDLWFSQRIGWLSFRAEQGLGYTLIIGRTPVRVQSESDIIRPVMPGERTALDQLRPVLPIFADDFEREGILRVEVHQLAGKPVDRVTLILFNEHSGAEFDRWVLYLRKEKDQPGKVLNPRRPPPQDVDLGSRFDFASTKVKADGDDD